MSAVVGIIVGCAVGSGGTNTGLSVGSVVAVDVEALVGSNVNVQAEYDGNNVGHALGAS